MSILPVSGARLRALFATAACAVTLLGCSASAAPSVIARAPLITLPSLQPAGSSTRSGSPVDRLLQGTTELLSRLSGNFVEATPGTISSDGYVFSDGVARRFVLIRPNTGNKGAPVLVLMHPKGLSPEKMANLTRVGRLAAQYGVWVYLPEGQLHNWNDDPAGLGGPDDVAFLRRLIDSSIAGGSVDAQRIFLAGYSNGGFMAERAACELSSRVAGLATVAAPVRDSVAASCRPSHRLPVIQFHGTGDLIIPYNGLPGINSAPTASAFWARQSQCALGQTQVNALPNSTNDGTNVQVSRYAGCPAGTGVALYTIDHGGHTWPGSVDKLFTAELGLTSSDIDATLELWRFFSPYSLKQ